MRPIDELILLLVLPITVMSEESGVASDKTTCGSIAVVEPLYNVLFDFSSVFPAIRICPV
jgi:hypothetical protein